MKAKKLFLALSLFLFSSIAGALDGNVLPEQSFLRCTFFNGKNVIHYHFSIDKGFGTRCSYGIEADGKTLYKGRAFAKDCNWYIRTKLTKGEVCMTSDF